MSGLEAIAIVGCVTGLIQALDAGSRIVKQIKQRRQAHGALPPSDLLEATIENGKQQIEQIVAKGTARFGTNFEAGDDTARLAIFQITIQIQNALLQRLTLARSDDGVIDFDECIDLSDQGCTDALVALQALYQRKLKEDIERKKEREAKQVEDDRSAQHAREVLAQTVVQPPKPTFKQAVPEDPKPIMRSESIPAPQPNESRKRGFGSMFHSRRKEEQSQQLPTPAPSPSRRDTAPPSQSNLHRTSTTSSQASNIPEKPELKNRLSMSSQHSDPNPAKRSNDQVVESHSAWSSNWAPGMSRASTLARIGPNAAIASFGGTCKYAHALREKGSKAGLGMVNTATYSQHFIYQCRSTKCSFGKEAVKTEKGWEIDDTIHTIQGIRFRWIFLAKSHIQIPMDSQIRIRPYKCLICLVLHHSSETYIGAEELFSHICQHREKKIGETLLAAPLSFSNQGAVADEKFDISLPDFDTPLEEPQKEHGTSQVVAAEEVRKKLEEFATGKGSESSSMVSYDTTTTSSAPTDPSFNPWALH